MKIWLAYVNYPITTAVYIRRALLQAGHQVTTIGPRLPEEAIGMWGLENMKLPLDGLAIETDFTPDMAVIWEETPADERPDLYLWVESVNSHRPQNLDQLPCIKACYLIDTHYHLPEAIAMARPFDMIFIAQLIDLQAFRDIYPHTCWLPLACDPEIHGRQRVPQQYDIGFVGSMNQRREEMLAYLSQQFTVHHERSFWTDMARTFSASRIVLNDASFDDLNMRFFEVLCSGALLLSNPTRKSGQEILFIEDEDYVCHRDYDLLTVACYYLQRDELRRKIAATGRQRVLAAHTYQHRVVDMLDVITGKKPDTFSPQELRARSLQGETEEALPLLEPPPGIRSIITTRYRSNWPTWQMVHEWEDILATILAVPLRPIGESCMLPDPDCPPGNHDLMFLQLAGELRYYADNPQLIPIVMDLWRDDFAEFVQLAPRFRLIFVTSLQAFQELSPQLPQLHYLPFCLADQHLDRSSTIRDIDIIHYGRRNPLLEQYMERLLTEQPELQYVTTEAFDNEQKVRIYSNQQGCLGESDSRATFMALLDRSRISLVSTVGMDGSRQTGGIDPISPRFLESMAAGCHLVGRIPENLEFRGDTISGHCHSVDSYEGFKTTVLSLLTATTAQPDYRHLLCDRLASSLAPKILAALASQYGLDDYDVTAKAIARRRIPRIETERRLDTLKGIVSELEPDKAFINYYTLLDSIHFYRRFHNLDLSDLLPHLIRQQTSPAAALYFSALDLAGQGSYAAACQLAQQSARLEPDNPQAAFLLSDLLRRSGQKDRARLQALQALKQRPDNQSCSAVLDSCAIDDALPLELEHYELLHQAHRLLHPRRYIEIGISNGRSLALAGRNTAVIGIDPETACNDKLFFHSPETTPSLHKLGSNEFFLQGCYEQVWGDQPFDIAFIDGLHLFEQALMDFINLEQHSDARSIIFIHDCLPVNPAGAERERRTMVWTGDVWKVLACLKAVRPDLEIVTFPVRPSGLAMVRGLDRSSTLLQDNFEQLVARFMHEPLPQSMTERLERLNVTSEQPSHALSQLAQQQGRYQ
jgi:tetratricopeptide (TPR) repeat protein